MVVAGMELPLLAALGVAVLAGAVLPARQLVLVELAAVVAVVALAMEELAA